MRYSLTLLLCATILAGSEPPAFAASITVAIDRPSRISVTITRPDNWVVRELLVDAQVGAGNQVFTWDGRDNIGRLMPAGGYQLRVLTHDPIGWKHVASIGNSGTPNWMTAYTEADGIGGWGGNHGNPTAVAVDSSGVYMGWCSTEGPFAMMKRDADGGKGLWGKSLGAFEGVVGMASDGRRLFGVNGKRLIRINPANGEVLAQIADHGAAKTKDIKTLVDVPGSLTYQHRRADTRGHVWGIAAGGDRVWLSLPHRDRIAAFDAETLAARPDEDLPVPRAKGLALDGQGGLLAVVGREVVRYDLKTKQGRPLVSAGLVAPFALTRMPDGTLLVGDLGTSQQIKRFAADGTPTATYGRAGGGTDYLHGGQFDPGGFREVCAIAPAADGGFWAVEDAIPKRIVHCNADGSPAREFFGSINYAATCAPNPLDPSEVFSTMWGLFSGTVDYAAGTSRMGRILPIRWGPGGPGELAGVNLGMGPDRTMVRDGRLYIWTGSGNCLALVESNHLRPVMAYWPRFDFNPTTKRLSEASGIKPTGHARECVLWCDRNDDGTAQADEFCFGQMPKGRGGGFAIAPDFTIHAPVGYLWKPRDFTPGGVPIYETSDISETPGAVNDGFPFYSSGTSRFCGDDGNFYHLFRRSPDSRPAGKGFWAGRSSEHVIASFDASWKPRWFVGRKAIGSAKPGEVYYPYRNAGMMAGCLFVSDMEGVVHLIHRDGFFVTTILQDPYRKTVPGPDLLQVENFSGSVMEDPKTGAKRLYISSHQATHVFEISGLESIRILPPVSFTISGPQPPAFAAQVPPQECLIRRTMGARPAENGFLPVHGIDWRRDAFPLLIQRDGRPAAEIRMLYDDQNLYVLADLLTDQRFEAVVKTPEQPKKTPRNAPKPEPDLANVRSFGAAIELLVGMDPLADPERSAPGTGDQRFVAIQFGDGKWSGVLRQRQVHGPGRATSEPGGADPNQSHTYIGPVSRLAFDDVRFLGKQQKVRIDRELPLQGNGHIIFFMIPWHHILLPGQTLADLKGKRMRFDAGVIWPGAQPVATYWQGRNPAMRLTGDPAVDESLTPNGWGWLRLDDNLPSASDDTASANMVDKPIRIDGGAQDWDAQSEEHAIVGDAGYVARFRTAWDTENFYASAQVKDDSPLLNAASDPRVLFKGGDMIAFCFGSGETAVKVAMTSFKDKPVIVLYRPKSSRKEAYEFVSPVGRLVMDEVRLLTIPVSFLRKPSGWFMECAIPWNILGLDPQPGQSIPFDVQVNSSDPSGQTNARVAWWHARSASSYANLDIPTEARLYPAEWGRLVLGRKD